MAEQAFAHEMLHIAISALEKVANPIGSAVKHLPEGVTLEENWRYIVTSPDYITGVARDALHQIALFQSNRRTGSLIDMMEVHGRDKRYWRPELPTGAFAYYHEKDDRIYLHNGLAPFGNLRAQHLLSRDWHIVVNGEEARRG